MSSTCDIPGTSKMPSSRFSTPTLYRSSYSQSIHLKVSKRVMRNEMLHYFKWLRGVAHHNHATTHFVPNSQVVLVFAIVVIVVVSICKLQRMLVRHLVVENVLQAEPNFSFPRDFARIGIALGIWVACKIDREFDERENCAYYSSDHIDCGIASSHRMTAERISSYCNCINQRGCTSCYPFCQLPQ